MVIRRLFVSDLYISLSFSYFNIIPDADPFLSLNSITHFLSCFSTILKCPLNHIHLSLFERYGTRIKMGLRKVKLAFLLPCRAGLQNVQLTFKCPSCRPKARSMKCTYLLTRTLVVLNCLKYFS